MIRQSLHIDEVPKNNSYLKSQLCHRNGAFPHYIKNFRSLQNENSSEILAQKSNEE